MIKVYEKSEWIVLQQKTGGDYLRIFLADFEIRQE
jgi:hypothetical protein